MYDFNLTNLDTHQIDGCTVYCGGGLLHQQEKKQYYRDGRLIGRLKPHLVYSSPWKRLVDTSNIDPASACKKNLL